MNTERSVEHFVTLFNQDFLPLGLTLYSSLLLHAKPFCLWVVCMDEKVEESLNKLRLDHLKLVPLREIETKELLDVKPSRTIGEYCWTLTSFTPKAVFDRDKTVGRVTYVDADIFFFGDPMVILDEFQRSQKHVLITEHAYAPEYDQTQASGRFCVQFMTFRRTVEGEKVMKWWQDRCVEWCFAKREGDKLGDQMYLNCWPNIFGGSVHVLEQVDKTLAPWNVNYFSKKMGNNLDPVFYHFEGLRILTRNKVQLYSSYKVGKKGIKFYDEYIYALKKSMELLERHNIHINEMKIKSEKWRAVKHIVRLLLGKARGIRV